MQTDHRLTRWTAGEIAILLTGVVAALVIHLPLLTRIGFHQDEYYFIACARHLSVGYVDHPPLVPWSAWLSLELFGPQLFGLRLFPALAGACTVALTASTARALGGRPFAQLCAVCAVLLAPVYLRAQNMLCLVAYEPLFWTGSAYLLVRILRGGDRRLWLALGLVVGLGLLNKHTMLLWCFALALGLVVSPQRAQLRTPWPWLAGALALLLVSPNLVWQIQHDWPTVQFIHGLSQISLQEIPRLMIVVGQVVYQGPVCFALGIAGAIHLGLARQGRLRALGVAFAVTLTVVLWRHGKPYYTAAAYPAFVAAGAVWLERSTAALPAGRWLRGVALAAVVLTGAPLALIALPWLPVKTIDDCIARVGAERIIRRGELTADLHRQRGWPELVRRVAKAYHRLDPVERQSSSILSRYYSAAAAVDFYGAAASLPPAFSGHMNYYLWGKARRLGSTIIAIGFTTAQLERYYRSVSLLDTVETAPDVPMLSGVNIHLCRGPRYSPAELWPKLKLFDFRPWNEADILSDRTSLRDAGRWPSGRAVSVLSKSSDIPLQTRKRPARGAARNGRFVRVSPSQNQN